MSAPSPPASWLPPGVEIGPTPPELKLDDDADDCGSYSYRHRFYGRDEERTEDVKAFPEPAAAGTPYEVLAKLFGCSGAVDSTRYREATRYRAMPDMGWEEARVALNRLLTASPRDYIALAEFALTAAASEPFAGKKGDHAGKLRRELDDVIGRVLHRHLAHVLHTADDNLRRLARPIASLLQPDDFWCRWSELQQTVPTAADAWVPILHATPEQVLASLAFLRAVLASWSARRRFADNIAERLGTEAPPTAVEYAEAQHVAEMLAFTTGKLAALHLSLARSMPIYRMHPATSEREAIELWWPWGRPVPLVDGGPAKPPPARKAVLDPSIITATRPTDVVKQVIERTGMNRVTAQRLTATLRRDLRNQRRNQAETMLYKGATRAAVAKAVGLSPSRISAMFKGRAFKASKPRRRSKSSSR